VASNLLIHGTACCIKQHANKLNETNNNKGKIKMVIKPAISFLTADSDPLLASDGQTIVTALTDNLSYPNPSPALPVVQAAVDAFNVAIANAAKGGTELTAIKNAKRAELVALLRQLALYVSATCGGDLAKLLSSGYPVQKPTRTPVGPLPAPVTPVVTQGNLSGSLDAATTPMAGAVSYGWRVALASAPDVDVQTMQTSAASTEFDGLTPGLAYIVEVNALGAAGTSDWSNTAQIIVV
jgi:hypothetical protein